MRGKDSFLYDFDRKSLIVGSSDQTYRHQPEGYAFSVIENNGHFLRVSFVPQKGNEPSLVQFSKWNPRAGTDQVLSVLNDLLAEDLERDFKCVESRLEGSFFKLSDSAVGYLFYRSSRFLVYRSDTVKLTNGVINYPFVKYSEKETEFGGSKIAMCQPNVDAWVHMSASGSNGKVYFLSNIIEKGEKRRPIDVYEAATFKYLFSFPAPNFKDEQPTDIIVNGSKIVLAYESGKLYSYEIKE